MQQLRRFRQFVIEVWAELKKTTWPGRQEVYGTTMVVIVTVLICAFFLWIVDLLLNKGMEQIFRAAGQ
jgi:preprotein translocase subunit SecE